MEVGMELSVGNDHRNGAGVGDLPEEMAHEELFLCAGSAQVSGNLRGYSGRDLFYPPWLGHMTRRSTRKWKAN